MLHRVITMPTDVLSVIMYVDSASLEYLALTSIRSKFDVGKDYDLLVDNEKSLPKLKSSTNITPLVGKKWLLQVDADKVGIKAIEAQASVAYDSCVVVYKTAKYGVYKRLVNSKFRKEQGRYCLELYGGMVDEKDIKDIASCYDVKLDEKVIKLLVSKYNRAPQSVCSLCSLVKSGYSISSDKDIISAVGLGGISVASFVLNMLTTLPNTAKGRKTAMKNKLIYLDNLAEGLSYSSIQNFILDTLSGLIDIKLAMIAGELSILNSEPPSSYKDKRANRFRRLLRYRYMLKTEISLEQLIAVRGLYVRSFDARTAILNWILRVYDFVGLQSEEIVERTQRIDSSVPIDASFCLEGYNAFGDELAIRPAVKSAGRRESISRESSKQESSKKESSKKEATEPNLLSILLGGKGNDS